MSDVLCVTYSRSGNTYTAAMEIAEILHAEVAEIRYSRTPVGRFAVLRCGMDAMRRTPPEIRPIFTEHPLAEYKLVVLCAPVWAGRMAAPMRAFLTEHGKELQRVACLITRNSSYQNREVFAQMDRYLPAGHLAEVSLRAGKIGYEFWRDQFLRELSAILENMEP